MDLWSSLVDSGFLADVGVAARLLIGAIFLTAGILKLRTRPHTEHFIAEIGIPQPFVSVVYASALLLELTTGVLLIVGLIAVGASLASALFILFIFVLIKKRDASRPCPCLGRAGRGSGIAALPLRIAGLLVSATLFFMPRAGIGVR